MKALYKEMLRNLDISKCDNILDYFFLLKKTFNNEELIFDILQVSYSTYYQFLQNAKQGKLLHGKMYKQLLKLETFTKTGVIDQ